MSNKAFSSRFGLNIKSISALILRVIYNSRPRLNRTVVVFMIIFFFFVPKFSLAPIQSTSNPNPLKTFCSSLSIILIKCSLSSLFFDSI